MIFRWGPEVSNSRRMYMDASRYICFSSDSSGYCVCVRIVGGWREEEEHVRRRGQSEVKVEATFGQFIGRLPPWYGSGAWP
jgi:hypothetical protein